MSMHLARLACTIDNARMHGGFSLHADVAVADQRSRRPDDGTRQDGARRQDVQTCTARPSFAGSPLQWPCTQHTGTERHWVGGGNDGVAGRSHSLLLLCLPRGQPRGGCAPPPSRNPHPAATTSLHGTYLKLVAYSSAVVCGAVPVFDQVSSRLEWPRDHATTGVAIVQRSA